MAIPPVPPRFQPRQHTQGSDWYIFVMMPNGDTSIIEGFASKAEAEQWIEKESASWEEKHTDA